MQDVTCVDKEDRVVNPCFNCPHDCPHFCDCEVCEVGDDEDWDDEDWDDEE